jgi:hypothetical protein
MSLTGYGLPLVRGPPSGPSPAFQSRHYSYWPLTKVIASCVPLLLP